MYHSKNDLRSASMCESSFSEVLGAHG